MKRTVEIFLINVENYYGAAVRMPFFCFLFFFFFVFLPGRLELISFRSIGGSGRRRREMGLYQGFSPMFYLKMRKQRMEMLASKAQM